MASHVDKTSHLPTVLGIAAVEVDREAHHPVSRYNVSVLFAQSFHSCEECNPCDHRWTSQQIE